MLRRIRVENNRHTCNEPEAAGASEAYYTA